MSICCVLGCDVTDSDDITYFTFPIKPALRKKWRAAIPTAHKLHDDSKVCAHHFRQTDYEWIRGKLRLKSGVVPCIFAADKTITESNETPKTTKTVNNDNCEPELTETELAKPELPETGLAKPELPATELPNTKLPEPELPEAPDFFAIGAYEREDENAENCTIECVPEAILNHDSDSHSEVDIHKEDLEDIIANYHIKQNKELAERLKASEELDRKKQLEYLLNKDKNETNTENSEKIPEIPEKSLANGGDVTEVSGNGRKLSVISGKFSGIVRNFSGKRSKSGGRGSKRVTRVCSESTSIRSSQDSDCVITDEPKPQFVEISVDKAGKDNNDCMMLLESVQVDVDPNSLLQDYHPLIADEPTTKEEAISLLTSSDSDDVILQEPHIDTVEVSSTDSESTPLVRLVAEKMHRLYPCFDCRYTTHSQIQYRKHRRIHTRPQAYVCACGATFTSKSALRRHERTHPKFQCHLCDFQGTHSDALLSHMQSHTIQTGDDCIQEVEKSKTGKKPKRKKMYRCGMCTFVAARRKALNAHKLRQH